MTKPNLHEKIDDLIMAQANTAVRGWNWLTGRTKGDLANTLGAVGSLGKGLGFFQ